MNYLISSAIGVVLWGVVGPALSQALGNWFILDLNLADEWRNSFVLLTGIAAAAGIALTCIWYAIADNPRRAGRTTANRSSWKKLFFVAVLVAGALTGVITALYYASLGLPNLLISFFFMSLHTWIFLWLNGLLFTRGAKCAVWLRC